MEIKDFYGLVHADYEGTLTRLMNDRLINKYVRKFPGDPSFGELTAALESKDWNTAFRSAHTMKGVCANLGFTELQKASSELTEALRGGAELKDFSLYENVKREYEFLIDAIGKLD